MVQEAKEEDLKDIYSLICELEQEQINQEHFRDVYNQGLKSPHVKFYVYFYEKKIIGFISLYIHQSMISKRSELLVRLWRRSWCYR